MKNIILASILAMITCSLPAQDRDQVRLQDHLLLKDGIVLQVRDQDQIQLRDKLTLLDGSMVDPDGSYVNAMGQQLRLRNGECLDMDGNWYQNQEQFQQKLQMRMQAMQQLHYVMQDGKVFQIKNQERMQLKQQANLQNGGKINPDGSFQLREQQQMRLRDGECLDEEGNYYGSETQFRNHTQLRLRALAQEHFMYQDGQMFRVQNRMQTQLNEPLNMQNGMTIFPDGSFQLRQRDQDRIRLQNGECLDPEGNVYANQRQFKEQAQIRLQAMDQEHFIFQDGKMFQVRNQERNHVKEKMALANGLTINPDGTYQMRNQKQSRLASGECLDPDGNRYANMEQYQKQMQNRFQAMTEPHFRFENGQMWRNQNQVQTQLKESWSMQNGSIVNPDGTYQLKNGKKFQLKDGEFLDWECNRYENRDRFRERMELRVRDRMDMRNRDMMERKRPMEPRMRGGKG